MKTALIASIALLWPAYAQIAVPGEQTVRVLRPDSRDTLQPGATFRIQWREAGITNNMDWSISLYTNDVRLRFVFATPVDDGDGNWHADLSVPSDLLSGCDYTLNVSDDVSDTDDYSEAFCLGPKLSILATGLASVRLSWPSAASDYGYLLQQSLDLSAGWSISNQGVLEGSERVVRLTGVSGHRFFRLATLPQPPLTNWIRVSASGTASSTNCGIYLNGMGRVYLDDIRLVYGTNADVGTNLLSNGDFEGPTLTPPWFMGSSISGSATLITNSPTADGQAASGSNCLLLVASSGTTTLTAGLWQPFATNSPSANQRFTLSFSYLPVINLSNTVLTVRLSGSTTVRTITLPSTPPPMSQP